MNWRRCCSSCFLAVLLFWPVSRARGEGQTEAPVSLPQQCHDYYSFQDYEKTIKIANMILADPVLKKDAAVVEETLYYINESAEEIRQDIQDRISVTNAERFMQKCLAYRKELKIRIDIVEDGFYYDVNYRHDALEKLIKMNPESLYIERIKLRRLLRISQYNLDPVYRFREDLRILDLFHTYISNYPGTKYLPNLLAKTADLYFKLHEQASLLKDQIGYSDRQVQDLYDRSKALYKYIFRNYPHSEVSQFVGEIIMNKVKLRKDPSTKTHIIKIMKRGTLVRVLERSETRYSIGNMYDYWYKVRLPDGTEGWVYGVYLNTGYGQ